MTTNVEIGMFWTADGCNSNDLRGGHRKMKIITLSSMFLAVAACSDGPTKAKDQAQEATLQRVAQTIRDQAPIRVDEYSTMVGAIAEGKTVAYFVTVSVELEGMTPAEAQIKIQTNVTKTVCGNNNARAIVESGAKITYRYSMPSGQSYDASVTSCA